ncbi:MAG: SusC/RagA family TonB-linked outer membrane protein, partial [Bacteroidota bacterium]|nr:SusC/RagA family TonB-linked outer membrane protein [Bacteroidota bacterium]
MKKIREPWVSDSYALKKCLAMMKWSLFFFFLSIIQVLAVDSYSQQTRLTLKFNQVSLESVLNEIENKSEFYFLYNQDFVNTKQNVDLDVKSAKIEDVLNSLLKSTEIKYTISDRQIVLTNADNVSGLNRLSVQQSRISGKVTGTSGEALPGVTVAVKGTSGGTITDNNGNFQLNLPADAKTLVFSFVGMKSQEVAIAGKTTFNIVLEEESIGIEEVVAIGYGTAKRRDVTGSVGSVKAKNIKDLPVSNPSQALQGQIAGVDVKQTSATPGGGTIIRVRGAGSISASSSPLYVVDGYPLGDQNLNAVNPNDIESIEILKDASAAAIYGSRGANGVVLITTKSGKSGKLNINFDTYAGIQQVGKKMDVLNRDEFIAYSKEAFNTNYTSKVTGANSTDPLSARPSAYRYKYPEVFDTNASGLPDTDWQDEIFRSAPVQNYQLSLSGGDNKTQYMFSGGYYNQEGIVINTDYQRFNARAKVETKLNDFLRMGINLSSNYSQENRLNEGHWASDGVVLAALATS